MSDDESKSFDSVSQHSNQTSSSVHTVQTQDIVFVDAKTNGEPSHDPERGRPQDRNPSFRQHVHGAHPSADSLPAPFAQRSSLMGRLRNALQTVHHRTIDVVETTKQKSLNALDNARTFLSNLIRRDHDTLEVDSSIAQHMIDKLTYQVNALLIASSWLGIGTSLYNIIAGVFVVIGDSGESQLWERAVVAVPPAIVSSIVTAIVIYLQQLQIVDKLKELTNVKTDTDYVISKLEPMYTLALRADNLEQLDDIDSAFRGETSALKQKARRAISKVIKKEDRAVHLRKYRYLMLQELYAKQQHELVRDFIMRYNELGLTLDDVAPMVENYGAFGSIHETNEEQDLSNL